MVGFNKTQVRFFLVLSLSGLLLLVSRSLQATESISKNWGVYGGAGAFHATNKDINNELVYDRFTTYHFGVNYLQWTFLGEFGQRSIQTGNETLEVATNTSYFLAGLQYSNWKSRFIAPYGAVALGAQTDSIQTTLYGSSDTSRGRSYPVLTTAVGIKSPTDSYVWYSVEGRLQFGEHLDPYPSLGILLSLGIQWPGYGGKK